MISCYSCAFSPKPIYECKTTIWVLFPFILESSFLSYKPSEVAAAAVCVARFCSGMGTAWSLQLEEATSYSLENLEPIASLMLRLIIVTTLHSIVIRSLGVKSYYPPFYYNKACDCMACLVEVLWTRAYKGAVKMGVYTYSHNTSWHVSIVYHVMHPTQIWVQISCYYSQFMHIPLECGYIAMNNMTSLYIVLQLHIVK